MAKKWTTLRKVETPEESQDDANAEEQAKPSRTPRRRQQARQEAVQPVPTPEAEQPRTTPEGHQILTEPAPGTKHVRPIDIEEPRILVVHDAAATYRLVEETFGNFTKAKVDSTSDVLNAFEMAIKRDYQLFIIALTLPGMSGVLFYEMVARGYQSGLGSKKLAPAVVYVRDDKEPLPADDVTSDVRVKAVWTKPLNIERMLDSVASVIKRCDPAG